MNAAKVLSYAKLNLTLDITGKQGDYHMLDSLVVTVGLYDKIVAKKRRDGLCSVTMHGMGSESIPPERNNALRAAEAFVSRFQTAGADLTVYKNIPVGAGMGGSSADAAGVLNALSKLYAVTSGAEIKALADELGSDTGYLLRGGFARIRGRGNEVEYLGDAPEMHFLLLCPESGVSTKECYHAYDAQAKNADMGRTERCIEAFYGMGAGAAAKLFYNDLYPAAASLNNEVERALLEAKSFSPSGAGMTGSGSAVFALFETRELAEWAKSRYRGKCRAYCVSAVDGVKNKFMRSLYSIAEE